MPFDRRRSGVPIDEFRALVSASFDNIGDSHLDLSPAPASHTNHASYMHPLLENDEPPADEDATPRPARPVSGGSRRSAFSFLRKVKTSATSAVHDAVHGHPALPVASTPPTSFLPPSQSHTVTPGRSRTKSLPRSLLAFGLITPQVNEKPPPVPDLPKLHVNSAPAMQSFFDTDSDGDTPNATARVSARPASRRLSAIFASPPNQDELSAPSISSNESTRHLRLHSDSYTSKGPPKLSLTTKLRTKISRSRLSPFASTHPVYPYEEPLPTPALSFSPYSEVPSPMTSASSSFPRSPGSPAFEDARRYDAVRQGRAITPDDDPFRKGDLVYAGENSWNFVQSMVFGFGLAVEFSRPLNHPNFGTIQPSRFFASP
ncbi:hypothetical protein BV25DRAFT_1837954 [Artomyces pyxidatus]|uniref:Uncharacterized protein n=1 Tax=Artomyces pyxidatus TaxID=48021 RepID=A0ACB8T3E6_9AGAM|nr:hypothetical protein BV25DRAFT_1837954 [Artomyces pyxidatus]